MDFNSNIEFRVNGKVEFNVDIGSGSNSSEHGHHDDPFEIMN